MSSIYWYLLIPYGVFVLLGVYLAVKLWLRNRAIDAALLSPSAGEKGSTTSNVVGHEKSTTVLIIGQNSFQRLSPPPPYEALIEESQDIEENKH